MDGRALSHEILESYRFSAINLHKRGVAINDISQSFGVTRQAVHRWVRDEKQHGKLSLKSTKAPGPKFHLTEKQFSKLLSLIRQPATKLGYSTDLWSGPRIRHLIKREFKIEYHQKHMPRLLKNLGLELKFPERRAAEQDLGKVHEWKTKTLPEIIKKARKKRAILFYADESLISLIPYIGKTWTSPGTKPIVRISGKRGHIGVTAAVNQQGRLCFEVTKEHEKFTSKVFLRFLKKLRKEFPKRYMILIVDGAPVHKAKLIQDFQHQNKKWIEIKILPAYSPELNPTEKSWRFLKTKKLNGVTVIDKKELRSETIRSVKEIKKDKARVISFFKN